MNGDDCKTLLEKAGALLARRPLSRGELRDRLSKHGRESHVETVLNRLEQLNLLNDEVLAYNSALRRAGQGWASARVRNYLLRRKIEPSVIEGVLDKIAKEAGDEPGLARCIEKYLARRGMPANSAEVRKLLFYLSRRGYDEESVLNAVGKALPQELWRPYETGE